MAKITNSIKLGIHTYKNNVFRISFQLTGSDKHDPRYFAEFGADGIQLPFETRDALSFLTFQQLLQISDELVKWTYKPRRELSDKTPAQYMRGIIEAVAAYKADLVVLKKDRRAKAQAERIAAEAPPLDWAMSVTVELVDEPLVVVGSDHSCSPVGIFSDVVYQPANDATQLYVDAARDRIPAMEATGLGETLTVEVPEECGQLPTLAEIKLRKAKAEAVITEIDLKLAEAAATREYDEARYQARRKRAEDATDKAVNVIHNQARRFLKVMTLREHDF